MFIVIHSDRPSKNAESYSQEIGRAGRDGHQSVAYVLYHGVMLSHIDARMKSFIKIEECWRKPLLNHIESESVYPKQLHLCCDSWATRCKCGRTPSDKHKSVRITSNRRQANGQHYRNIRTSLLANHSRIGYRIKRSASVKHAIT